MKTDTDYPLRSAVALCDAIAHDMAADAKAFDGKPFDGGTVASYFGLQGAAIAALAQIVGVLAEHHHVENDVRKVAQDFVAHYTREGGCSHCGGVRHTTTCFVGRFVALGLIACVEDTTSILASAGTVDDAGLGVCADCKRPLIDRPGQAKVLPDQTVICEPCALQRTRGRLGDYGG